MKYSAAMYYAELEFDSISIRFQPCAAQSVIGQVTVLGSEGCLGGFRVVCGVGLPVEELGEDGVLH